MVIWFTNLRNLLEGMIFLFNSEKSLRVTDGCYEPLQQLWVRLGSCKTGLIKPASNFILLIVPRRYFCCGSYCFMYWYLIFVLLAPYVCYHILVKFR